ncbi:Metallo-beta-lactamase superfamily protein [Grimontia celer]|uniref:Metallo-beta-lactamase superfamily protein n=1 Tax=Grimontia celer TaxID=1796497 RepID=A0A128F8W7_9GAMM|nr:MBL fold metallo-hydrolase [Grimontia celer]CZF83219.1 Metallo-beta-lactamase superfamily protein [Grimontia celer]
MRKLRIFIGLFIAYFAFISTTQAEESGVVKIADNIYTFSQSGEYISMFAVTDDGVIVFETVNTPHAKAMVEAIKSVTDKPIIWALQTHNHWDHSSGGQVFLNEGTKILAHEDAAAWIKANPYPDMVNPTDTWSGARKDLIFGDMKVELHFLGLNHGTGMTVFVLPQQRIAYIADLVTPNRVVFAVVPDFNPREWERSLGEILELDFDRAVFSHNEAENPLQGGGKAEIQSQLEFIQDLRAGFYAELQKGTNPMQIPKVLKLPKYENWVGYDQWLEMNVWRILSDEFMGPYPWYEVKN